MLCISPKNYRKKDKILGHPNRYPNHTIIQFPYGDSSPTDYVGGGSLAMVAIDVFYLQWTTKIPLLYFYKRGDLLLDIFQE